MSIFSVLVKNGTSLSKANLNNEPECKFDLMLIISPSAGKEEDDVWCPVDELEVKDMVEEEDDIRYGVKLFLIPNPGDESTGDDVGEVLLPVEGCLVNDGDNLLWFSSLSEEEQESLM